MPKKAGSASKLPSLRNMAVCEIAPHGLQGDYYFVVKVVPATLPTAPPPGLGTRTLVTYHKVVGPARDASGNKTYELEARHGGYQTKKLVRFEILDLNEKLDSLKAAQCALATNEGQNWLDDAIDHVILKVKVS